MRVPDYNTMREMVAEREASNMNPSEMAEILYYGYDGYKYDSDEDIMDIFLQIYESKDIPKTTIDIDKQQCTTCMKLVCICKD